MKRAAKICPPLRKGENLPAARHKYEARTAVGLLRAGAAHTVLCQGLPSRFLHLRPLSPRLTPPPEGGWYILDDSKSLKRAREGGFLRFGPDQLGLQAHLPR